jgi:hypothetical protein
VEQRGGGAGIQQGEAYRGLGIGGAEHPGGGTGIQQGEAYRGIGIGGVELGSSKVRHIEGYGLESGASWWRGWDPAR